MPQEELRNSALERGSGLLTRRVGISNDSIFSILTIKTRLMFVYVCMCIYIYIYMYISLLQID